jgi:hypothetical protein
MKPIGYRDADDSALREELDKLRAYRKTERRVRFFGGVSDVAIGAALVTLFGMFTGWMLGLVALDSDNDVCAYQCATADGTCVLSTDLGSVCEIDGYRFTVPAAGE